MVPMLVAAGHEVVGLDSYLFAPCVFGDDVVDPPSLRIDVRDVEVEHLRGLRGGRSTSPGSPTTRSATSTPETTYDINHRATVRLAEVAKAAGVRRFLFSSSCSMYGAQGDALIDESGEWNPLTPYGESKARAEVDLAGLADDGFSPVYLRNATAYGVSPRLRGDLVVNNLTGFAVTTGRVFLKSDGSSWRPLIHVEDIARAFAGDARGGPVGDPRAGVQRRGHRREPPHLRRRRPGRGAGARLDRHLRRRGVRRPAQLPGRLHQVRDRLPRGPAPVDGAQGDRAARRGVRRQRAHARSAGGKSLPPHRPRARPGRAGRARHRSALATAEPDR